MLGKHSERGVGDSQAAADGEADPILCQQCGQEFGISQEPVIPSQAVTGLPRRGASKPGPVLALVIIVAMTGAYLTGYVPLGLALTIGLIGILAAIVIQLANR